MTELVFSGVQPTGGLHLGNYLGAIKRWVSLQEAYDCLYCVVDLHALTVNPDPRALQAMTLEMAAGLLGCGIDPQRHILFHQSGNPDHAELAWLLNCVARLGWLERMTQFKEKAGKNRERASTGLYVYPNLMAADILLYKTTHVPVGEDQKQHLELTREIAGRFNRDYAPEDATGFFPLPEPLILGTNARVMSLKDGTRKMSKSDPSELSRIALSDDNDAISSKIRRAKTDAHPLPEHAEGLEGRPEVANLVGILAGLEGCAVPVILERYGGRDFAPFKKDLGEKLITVIEPIRERICGYLEDRGELQRLLKAGAARAQARSAPVLKDVKRKMGLMV